MVALKKDKGSPKNGLLIWGTGTFIETFVLVHPILVEMFQIGQSTVPSRAEVPMVYFIQYP